VLLGGSLDGDFQLTNRPFSVTGIEHDDDDLPHPLIKVHARGGSMDSHCVEKFLFDARAFGSLLVGGVSSEDRLGVRHRAGQSAQGNDAYV
jgi:hypothetical protein